ncbi:MAG: hypothetical protein AAFN13_09480 [Bacteroidota bacterium]
MQTFINYFIHTTLTEIIGSHPPPTPLVMNNLDRMVRTMLIGAGVLGVGVFLLFQF